ncbi:hypothetical protein [Saccharopolyspora sp. 5N708]|uniref:hypothetical protein n=1 Tax=Saccharopolyspora sp. 5N708 TaxID=3457424 RepID=UPI003FD5852D
MLWKRRRRRAELEEKMAAFEKATAELISTYTAGDWDSTLTLANSLAEDLKPIATLPRMGICLYHAESIQLRIAYKREDVELIEAIARKSHDPEVSDKAFRTLTRISTHSGLNFDRNILSLDSILHESLRELRLISDAESQIVRMRNPDPALIGTHYFPQLYRRH